MPSNASSPSPGSVIPFFLAWKGLLLLVACASPGPGYDTSTQLLFHQFPPTSPPSWLARAVEHVALRLTRWDGIYFTSSSTRGHVYEQEWAFSWLLARITSALSTVLLSPFQLSDAVKNAMTGVAISHITHLLAVLVLYQLTFTLTPASKDAKRQVAFKAACLHIISPAGLFLSAPYGESVFAFLNFAGMLCYVYAIQERVSKKSNPLSSAMWTLIAGAIFGLATTMRSNGLLSGMLFAWDAIATLPRLRRVMSSWNHFIAFAATILAGVMVGIGYTIPQAAAYMEYCTAGNTRPWCTRLLPSIYTWVQDHYWEVGFLRYWTLNNLPLFLLATPTLLLLLYTSYLSLVKPNSLLSNLPPPRQTNDQQIFNHVIPRLSLIQLTLTLLCATTFHVQIINRISSGYPVWYMILAYALHNTTTNTKNPGGKFDAAGSLLGRKLQWVVRGMAMYALVQGGLYASFLPPA